MMVSARGNLVSVYIFVPEIPMGASVGFLSLLLPSLLLSFLFK